MDELIVGNNSRVDWGRMTPGVPVTVGGYLDQHEETTND